MFRYPHIVVIGLYLVLTCIEKLISTVCYFFSYFGVSIIGVGFVNYTKFLTCAKTETTSMFKGFSIVNFFLVSKLFKSVL